jgi:aspartate carbamoyltransferase catalytic subunit
MVVENTFKNRDIISVTDLLPEEILHLCEVADKLYKEDRAGERYAWLDKLTKRKMGYAFYEPSTRTRGSHVTSSDELGWSFDGFTGIEGTSIMKKESIRDTVRMFEANHCDVIVMRHPLDGSLQWAADVAQVPVINGGDGKNKHPTQGLLDTFTLYMFNNGQFNGLNMGFGGDLSHGRTIRSLSLALSHFDNITIRWAAEDFFGMPSDLEEILTSRNVKVERLDSVRDVLAASDFYYMTRPQLERITQKDLENPEVVALMNKYDIDLSRGKDALLEMAQRIMDDGYRIDGEKIEGLDVKIMHPLPINSVIREIDPSVHSTPNAIYYQQAENGIFLRKALLLEMLKHSGYYVFVSQISPEITYGNNRLRRKTREDEEDSEKVVRDIKRGIVIDHLVKGVAGKVADELRLEARGYDSIPGTLKRKRTAFLKTDLTELTDRELKAIYLLSPEPCINEIGNRTVSDKYVYLLCQNDNCVTRRVEEDVPPKFYYKDDTIRCRYCRKPYEIVNPNITQEERDDFIKSLPTSIEPIEMET